ncbi:MAG: proline dehydrogenase, partial [Solirubrobacteraceae bacterium]|nr:proline dehydrogenase [Solirubrobacteraceae bacterium]
MADAGLEPEIGRVGRALAESFPSHRGNPMKALDDRAMDLAAEDAELRAALFRFVDVVPACRSLDDLAAHLTSYLEQVHDQPPSLRAAMRMGDNRAGRAALGAAGAAGVRHMAHRFIVGADPAAALPTLRELWRDGIAASVDLLGEATVTAAEADRYAARCADALDTLAAAYAKLDEQPVLERDTLGPLPRANLSVKVSALTPLLRPEAPERGRRDAAPRLRELLRNAARVGAHLHIDMESLDSREAVLELVLELLAEPEFAGGPSAGVVLQAYLRDSPQTLDTILDWAASTPRAQPLVVRLVKGAYWDHEVVEARRHGWEVPVFERKADCDANFEALTARLLQARPLVRVAIASHNLRSVAHAIAANRLIGGADADLEL